MQAGGRRFDPVQLHHSDGGPRDVAVAAESRSKLRTPQFASGFLSQCYRLLFNNAEEVKQILLDGQGGGASFPSGALGGMG